MIGERVKRREDYRLLTGQGCFVDDLELDGVLHVAFVRSQHPHARIRSISVDDAAALAGVVGVFTPQDMEEINRPWPQIPHGNLKWTTRTALPVEKVRYIGEPVVAVVAADRYIAEDACELVVVDYEPLPGVGSCAVALAAEGEPIHTEAPDNIAANYVQTVGIPDDALAAAPRRLTATFRTTRGGGHSMEGRGVAARHDEAAGTTTVWSATQTPFLLRASLGLCFGEPEERFHVIAPPDVGGGFGPKAAVYGEELVVPWLARRLGRPVKWIEDRYEHFVSCAQEREQVHEVEVGFDDHGRVLVVKDVFVHDCGAYASQLIVPIITGATVPGPYKIPNLHLEFTALYTNLVPSSPVRGAGRPAGVFVMERVMDQIARELDLDPVEVRSRNLIAAEEFPYEVGVIFRDGSPVVYDSGNYPLLLRKALDAIDYPARRAEQRRIQDAGGYRGIGISVAVEGVGIGGFEGAIVRLTRAGKINLILSAPPQGQGHETTFAQICADAMGIDMDQIEVFTGDTGRIPFGVGTFASRVTANAGPSVLKAAAELREKIFRNAAAQLEANPDDLEFEDDRVIVRGTDMGMPLAQIGFVSNGFFLGLTLPEGVEPGLEASAYVPAKRACYSSSVEVCVVDVDPETGKTELIDFAVAHDCGTVINPLLVDGQIYGGVAHGIGNALYENPVFTADGQPLTTSYLDYTLPSAGEVPRIRTDHLETPSPLNALGAKGAGEAGTLGVPAAVAGAIEDALRGFGVRIDFLPLIPSRIADLVADAQRGQTGGISTSTRAIDDGTPNPPEQSDTQEAPGDGPA